MIHAVRALRLIVSHRGGGRTHRYVQLCRSLKTYGITCFQVKEKDKKKKNKMIPVLLGITRHAILRMDPETKEVIKEFPLPHLKQWSAAPAAFTMDFGDYEDSYYTVITNESDAISQVRRHLALS